MAMFAMADGLRLACSWAGALRELTLLVSPSLLHMRRRRLLPAALSLGGPSSSSKLPSSPRLSVSLLPSAWVARFLLGLLGGLCRRLPVLAAGLFLLTTLLFGGLSTLSGRLFGFVPQGLFLSIGCSFCFFCTNAMAYSTTVMSVTPAASASASKVLSMPVFPNEGGGDPQRCRAPRARHGPCLLASSLEYVSCFLTSVLVGRPVQFLTGP